MKFTEQQFSVAASSVFFALVIIFAAALYRNSNAHDASADEKRPFHVVTYQHEDGNRGSVQVVWDTRVVQNLDPGVTDLMTKLASVGWTPVSDTLVVRIPTNGCAIRVVAPSQERPVAPSVYGPPENCKPGVTLASLLFSPRVAGYSLGTYGYSGYRLVMQSR